MRRRLSHRDAILWRLLAACSLYVARSPTAVRGDCISLKYTAFPQHVGCLAASPSALLPQGVDLGDRNTIIDRLTQVRIQVMASDMQTLSWDLELASLAQRWAQHCNASRDENLSVPGRFASVGQIVASGVANWPAAVLFWSGKQQSFTYGNFAVMNYDSAIDYAQIVWASASIVGCGFSTCAGIGKFYVCNFAPGYPTISNYAVPYANGVPCNACPGACNQVYNLCDCGSVVCQNGGTLSLSSCSCTCAYPHDTGPSCGLSCSGIADPAACSSKKASDCQKSPTVPVQCPNLCQLCPYAAADYVPPTQSVTIAGNSSSSSSSASEWQLLADGTPLGLYTTVLAAAAAARLVAADWHRG